MENVKIADAKVAKLRAAIGNAKNKVGIPMAMEDAIGYLQALERLAAIERHLYNLTSNGYVND